MYPDKSKDEINDIIEDVNEYSNITLPEEPKQQNVEIPESETQQYEQ